MPKYTFNDDEPLGFKNASKANPQTVGEELARIASKHDGKLKASHVLAEAKAPRHVLHKFFEWDDVLAATQFRLDQARSMIRCVRQVVAEDEQPVRSFVSITDGKQRSYREITEVLSNRRLQLLTLEQATRDLAAWEKRFSELEDVCALVRLAREKLTEKAEELRPTV